MNKEQLVHAYDIIDGDIEDSLVLDELISVK